MDGNPVATATGHSSGPVGCGRRFAAAGLVPPLPARATKSVPSGAHVNPRGLVRPLATTGGRQAKGWQKAGVLGRDGERRTDQQEH
jgi:hypothetical protein